MESTTHVRTSAAHRNPLISTISVYNVITTGSVPVLYAREPVVIVSEDVSTEEVTPLTITSSEMSTSLIEGLCVTPLHVAVINRNLLTPVLTEVIILVAVTVPEATNVVANFAKVVADFHSISVESIHISYLYQCMSCFCVALCLRYG